MRLEIVFPGDIPSTQARKVHTSVYISIDFNMQELILTILNPSTILHQKSTLFSNVLPFTYLLL